MKKLSFVILLSISALFFWACKKSSSGPTVTFTTSHSVSYITNGSVQQTAFYTTFNSSIAMDSTISIISKLTTKGGAVYQDTTVILSGKSSGTGSVIIPGQSTDTTITSINSSVYKYNGKYSIQ